MWSVTTALVHFQEKSTMNGQLTDYKVADISSNWEEKKSPLRKQRCLAYGFEEYADATSSASLARHMTIQTGDDRTLLLESPVGFLQYFLDQDHLLCIAAKYSGICLQRRIFGRVLGIRSPYFRMAG